MPIVRQLPAAVRREVRVEADTLHTSSRVIQAVPVPIPAVLTNSGVAQPLLDGADVFGVVRPLGTDPPPDNVRRRMAGTP